MDEKTRYPFGKYKGVLIGLIPAPLLRAELDLNPNFKKRKYEDLRDFIQQKVDEYDRARED